MATGSTSPSPREHTPPDAGGSPANSLNPSPPADEAEASLQALLARSEHTLHTTITDESIAELQPEPARVFPKKQPPLTPRSHSREKNVWARWSQIKHALVQGVRGGPSVRHLPPAPPPPSHRTPHHLPPPPSPHPPQKPASESNDTPSAAASLPSSSVSEEDPTLRKVVRSGVSPIHTLHQDLNRVIRSGHLNIAKIAALEAERAAHPTPEGKEQEGDTHTKRTQWRKRDVVILTLSLIFLAAGAGGLVWAWRTLSPPPPITHDPTRAFPQFFKPDAILEYEIPLYPTRSVLMQNLMALRETSQLSLGSVVAVYPIKQEGEGKRPLSALEWLSLLEAHLPEELRNTLATPFMFGFHGYRGKPPYFVLSVRSLESGIRGMLSWEPWLLGDLAPLFGTPLAPTEREELAFQDAVVRNNDVRLLKKGDKELLVYGFATRNLLVITTNTVTYYELLSRIRRAVQVAPEERAR